MLDLQLTAQPDFVKLSTEFLGGQAEPFRHPFELLREHRAFWATLGYSSNEINVFTSVFLTLPWGTSEPPECLATLERILSETNLSRSTVQRILRKVPVADPALTQPALPETGIIETPKRPPFHPLGMKITSHRRGVASRFYPPVLAGRRIRPGRPKPAALTPKPKPKPTTLAPSAQLGLSHVHRDTQAKPGPQMLGRHPDPVRASQRPPMVNKQVTTDSSDLRLSSNLGCHPDTLTQGRQDDTLKPAQAPAVMAAFWNAFGGANGAEAFERDRLARGWRRCSCCNSLYPPHLQKCPKLCGKRGDQ